jgi:hypothetical protein
VLVGPCGSYQVLRNETNEASFDLCRQWLGPYQPGINAPDPTKPSGTEPAHLQPVSAAPARRPSATDAKAAAPLLDYLLAP